MIMSKENKARASLARKRTYAIIAFALAVVILLGAYLVITPFLKPTLSYLDNDGNGYYIRYKNGAYAMYTTDGELLPTESEYGYYVTKLGTLIELDPETGATKGVVIVDDLVEGETSETVTSTDVRVLMFPHITQKNILKLEVHNSSGSYVIERIDRNGELAAGGDLVLRDAPYATFNSEIIPALYSAAGYTISTQKLKAPIKDANGEYSEYGLVSEMRVDDEGNEYLYEPAYFVITDLSGKSHKVILGDMLLAGTGYYAQYVEIGDNKKETKRDAVYVLNPSTTVALYSEIETLIKPLLTYPMTINNYFDVENFLVAKKQDGEYKETVIFDYVDLSLRENTVNALFPYLLGDELNGYHPSSEVIDEVLGTMYEPTIIGVEKVVKNDSRYYKTLSEYGFYREFTNEAGELDYTLDADYIISFDFDVTDENGKKQGVVNNFILICGPNENGNYYTYTTLNEVKGSDENRELIPLYSYDTILEIDGNEFSFVEYDKYKWISRYYFELNIAFCDSIKIETPEYSASFELDNKMSDVSTSKSDLLSIIATDSLGNAKTTFGGLVFRDYAGYDWTINATSVVVKKDGKTQSIPSSYYAYNAMGVQALCFEGHIKMSDGSKVYVYADNVKINRPDGSTEIFVRYDTDNFRKYYQTFLNATIIDSYELDDEKEAALIADPDKYLMTLTLKDCEGTETVFRFYSLTARKAYITVNGNGGFYVSPARIEKFVSDAQRFFADQIITPTSKN